ncbi:MAG: serine/threonine-protein kinase, partial [Bryobacteraceae bacterium]
RWRKLEPLFHAALSLSGEERECFIERETAGDADLRRELRGMLQYSDSAGERIAGTVERIVRQAGGAGNWIGRRFGPYRVVREIGRGGMGVVFEAWRDDTEYDKTVALKVAPDWRDRDRLRERFRNERQILARLEHANIARFLDGGTADGVPYFVMEYIDGKPVTQWAKARKLGIHERIGLFQQICAAVHYAHENLIVHRDLKPANILVDRNDTPKLLDFGIATLLSPILEQTGDTTGARLWTPDYCSPEQVRGGAVTVRTDIYSLGLILYELLCGERAQAADSSSPLALERSICEAEPAPPSVRAAARGERGLSRQLRGDLDTIVATAIRKEPERRYRSAAALGEDLTRFLEG